MVGGVTVRKTVLYKNIWSELTRLRQSGTNDGFTSDKSQYFYYDARRRLCRTRTPEGGDTVFGLDAAGWLTSYAKGQSYRTVCTTPSGDAKVDLTRDALGQVTLTQFHDGNTPQISKSYDANGNVLTSNRGGANWTYAYDDVGSLLSEKLAFAGKAFNLYYAYDGDGRLEQRTLPTGRTVNFDLDALGRPTKAHGWGYDYATGMDYHPTGDVKTFTYGNGLEYEKTLDSMMRPNRIRSYKTSGAVFDRSYAYNSRSLITGITDAVDSTYTQTFTYDGLGQLKTATAGKWGTATYKYDSLGNIRSKIFSDWFGAASPRTVTMSYDDTTTNRLTGYVDNGPGGNKTLTYDARGNVTKLGGLNFLYDATDLPYATSGTASASYDYDGNGKRVRSSVGTDVFYNVYDASGKLVHIETDKDGTGYDKRTDYIHVAGMNIARIALGSSIAALHNDHLGSLAVGTNGNPNGTGVVMWEERYTPFGEPLLDHSLNRDQAGFTGHIRDDATGLNYMQARYYDPVGSRFLSIDPVTFMSSGGDPRFFNRYAYCYNDPINCTDPTGRNGVGLTDTDRAVIKQHLNSSNTSMGEIVTAAVGMVVDFVPVVGDAKGIGEAVANPTKANIAAAAIGIVPVVGDVAGKGIKNGDAIVSATKVRQAAGADGATSAMTKESINGSTTSMTHTVKKDGETLHQHQEHFGSSGSTKRFSDEMTGTDTVNAPDHIDTGPRLDKE